MAVTLFLLRLAGLWRSCAHDTSTAMARSPKTDIGQEVIPGLKVIHLIDEELGECYQTTSTASAGSQELPLTKSASANSWPCFVSVVSIGNAIGSCVGPAIASDLGGCFTSFFAHGWQLCAERLPHLANVFTENEQCILGNVGKLSPDVAYAPAHSSIHVGPGLLC